MDNKRLSIIIPHKNSGPTLARLLNSIPRIEGCEIIVVDDNSDAETLREVENLKSNHDFIFLSNQGRGAGGARNTGLRVASGKWVMFADADDFFLDSMNMSFENYYDSDADIIYFGATSCVSETGEPASRHLHIEQIINQYIKSGEEGYLRCKQLVPWAKMVKRTLIKDNNLTFEERCAGNDMWFAACTGIKARKIICEPEPIYCVTVSKGSITTTLSRDRFDDRFHATIKVNKMLRKHHYNKYQTSLLYFMGKAYQFGIGYMFSVLRQSVMSGTNLMIGLSKIFKIKQIMEDRQNAKFLVKQ